MGAQSFEIHICQNCGLRYPLIKSQTFGERCPNCLGNTVSVLEQSLDFNSVPVDEKLSFRSNSAVLLDNVRSAWNTGSIIRTAGGFEFQHVYLCGITPSPEVPEVRKTSLGAENLIAWSAYKNALNLLEQLQGEGYKIWALERSNDSVPLNSVASKLERSVKLILVVGNEITGVDPGILAIADAVVHLPMHGDKRSFNVAIAFALAAQLLNSKY